MTSIEMPPEEEKPSLEKVQSAKEWVVSMVEVEFCKPIKEKIGEEACQPNIELKPCHPLESIYDQVYSFSVRAPIDCWPFCIPNICTPRIDCYPCFPDCIPNCFPTCRPRMQDPLPKPKCNPDMMRHPPIGQRYRYAARCYPLEAPCAPDYYGCIPLTPCNPDWFIEPREFRPSAEIPPDRLAEITELVKSLKDEVVEIRKKLEQK